MSGLDNDLVVRVFSRKVAHQDDCFVHQFDLVVMLTIPQQVRNDVPELQGDAFLTQHGLHHVQVLPDDPMQESGSR